MSLKDGSKLWRLIGASVNVGIDVKTGVDFEKSPMGIWYFGNADIIENEL